MTALRLRPARFSALVAATVLAGLSLAGCANEAVEPTPTESFETPAETTTERVEPAEPAKPSVAPVPVGCDAILPINLVRGYDENLGLHAEGAEAEGKLTGLLGPVTMATIQAGTEPQYCGWAIPHSDAIAYLGVALIDEQAKAKLLAALRDSVYVEVDAGGAEAVFQQTPSSEHRYTDDIVIDGNLLIAVAHTIDGDFARDAWQTVQAARG